MVTQQNLIYYNEAVRKAIETTVNKVFTKAAEKCPVKTGKLRDSAVITKSNFASGQYQISFDANDTAPYAPYIEEGGTIPQHYRTNPRTGNKYTVQSYPVEGQFFIKEALDEVFGDQYNITVINANIGSVGYYVNL